MTLLTSTTPRVFFFHYNKPASQKAKRPQISVHYKNMCTIVDNVDVRVHTHGHKNKRQPYFVMKGRARSIELKDLYTGARIAIIT